MSPRLWRALARFAAQTVLGERGTLRGPEARQRLRELRAEHRLRYAALRKAVTP